MKKSILAGILISIGCIIFTSVQDRIIGSFLFSLGLLAIVNLKLNLYTGKIGYCKDICSLEECCRIFFGNVIGCTIVALLSVGFVDVPRIESMVEAKCSINPFIFFCKSIFCGIMMYIGVDVWKHGQPGCYIAPIMAVMVFILAGFEHSVADTYYFIISLEPKAIMYIPIAFVGNGIGAIFVNWLKESNVPSL